MPVDREETLKKAERLLKQGKVADAIAEYVRLVEDRPSDWNSANALGDLYLKVGQIERAAEQFTRAADHLYGEGFFPRASAVYKKVLKVSSADDHALWQLADIAGRNGLSLDARSYYGRVMQDRRAAGNAQGAVDCVIRLGLLRDASVDARRTAARALVDRGESKQAARLILSIADLFTKEERLPEAFEALKESARLDPYDQEIQLKLVAAEPPPAPAPDSAPALAEQVNPPVESGATFNPRVEPEEASREVVMPEPAEVASVPDDLSLESFFEELRGRVARDQDVRAREQLERGLRHVAENREEKP